MKCGLHAFFFFIIQLPKFMQGSWKLAWKRWATSKCGTDVHCAVHKVMRCYLQVLKKFVPSIQDKNLWVERLKVAMLD